MKLIPAGDVAKQLGVKTNTLAKWRKVGKGPQGWVYLGSSRVAYPEEKIREYMMGLSDERPVMEKAHE